MNDKLCIFVCDNLFPEVSSILQSGYYLDVKAISFASACSGTPMRNESISSLISRVENKYSKVIVIVSTCYPTVKEAFPAKRNIEIITLEQCFEIFLNIDIIYHYIKEGYYIISHGWLKNYKRHILDWGFTENSAKKFFGESLKKILFLDTGLTDDFMPKLVSVSEYMGLPYEILPVGLSHCHSFLDTKISEWRAEVERICMNEKLAKVSKESADYSFIYSQLQNLVDFVDELKIVKEVFSLLNILFAPAQIGFVKYNNEIEVETIWLNSNNFNLQKESEDYFTIEVIHQKELLGIFEIYGVKFPAYLEQYKNTESIISRICGVSIINARRYKIIQDQKKQLQVYSNQLKKTVQSKDKFFSIIAHDLRSPFNSILGLSNLLIEQVREKDYEEIDKYANYIIQSSTLAMDLLMNLLEWAQSQTGRLKYTPETFDITMLINDMLRLFANISKQKAINIIFEEPQNISVYADKAMISTILRNLVSNAIKYTLPLGVITIKAFEDQNEIIVSISDTGVGIPENDIEKLFRIDQNYSTLGTQDEKGTGLGLILCQELIAENQGKIWVESKVGKGSTFYFTIPYNTDTENSPL